MFSGGGHRGEARGDARLAHAVGFVAGAVPGAVSGGRNAGTPGRGRPAVGSAARSRGAFAGVPIGELKDERWHHGRGRSSRPAKLRCLLAFRWFGPGRDPDGRYDREEGTSDGGDHGGSDADGREDCGELNGQEESVSEKREPSDNRAEAAEASVPTSERLQELLDQLKKEMASSMEEMMKNDITEDSKEKRNEEAAPAAETARLGGARDRGTPSGRPEDYGLLEYVKRCEFFDMIDELETLAAEVPADTLECFRRTALSILGSLPRDSFEVRFATTREMLARLLFTLMMTGYSFHGVEVRMKMDENFEAMAAAEGLHDAAESRPPEGQRGQTARSRAASSSSHRRAKRQIIGGKVVVDGREMSAAEYIEMLESRLGPSVGDRVMLMEYMRVMGAERVGRLQPDLKSEAAKTMQYLIRSLLGLIGRNPFEQLASQFGLAGKEVRPPNDPSDAGDGDALEFLGDATFKGGISISVAADRDYLHRLVIWSLVVGYRVRATEVMLEMRRACLGLPKSDSKENQG